MSPLPITGTPRSAATLPDQVPVRRLAVALLAGAPVDRDRVGPALLAGPRHVRDVDLVLVPAGPQLDRHRDGDGALHRRHEPAERGGLAQQARPEAPARDLVDRAAAVEVHEARPARLGEPCPLDEGLRSSCPRAARRRSARPGGSSGARTRSSCPRGASRTTAISPTVTSAPISVHRRRKGRLPPTVSGARTTASWKGEGALTGRGAPGAAPEPARGSGRGRLRALLRSPASPSPGREEEVRLRARAAGRTSRGSGRPPRTAPSWVPRSTIRPFSTTRIWSARRIVERRWAITNVVRPFMSQESPSWMRASDSESRLDVASSRIRIRGSARIARAIATRCRWPPESRTPRSPTTVSYPSAKASANSSDVGDAARLEDLGLARRGAREGHVLADRAVEEEGLLQDDAEVAAVGVELARWRGRRRPRGRGPRSACGRRRRGR